MIPLDKGATPIDAITGLEIQVANYRKWRAYLVERIGPYCAYCNAPLTYNLQVEHVQPINPAHGVGFPDPLNWNNLLLSCGPCNLAKSDTIIDFDRYYFPHLNNTLLALVPTINLAQAFCIISPVEKLSHNQKKRQRLQLNYLSWQT